MQWHMHTPATAECRRPLLSASGITRRKLAWLLRNCSDNTHSQQGKGPSLRVHGSYSVMRIIYSCIILYIIMKTQPDVHIFFAFIFYTTKTIYSPHLGGLKSIHIYQQVYKQSQAIGRVCPSWNTKKPYNIANGYNNPLQHVPHINTWNRWVLSSFTIHYAWWRHG